MTAKQMSWTMFLITLVILLILLSVLVRVNYDLDQTRRTTDDLQKQISLLKKSDDELRQKVINLSKTTQGLAHDIDITQELQRKQAQVVVDIRKGKKK
jgi:cell division protein FtsL